MINRRTRRRAVLLALTAVIAGGIVVAPTAATAQVGASDQYTPPGNGNEGGGNQGDAGNDVAGTGNGAGTAESDGGDLPFTGYPLTRLVAVFLLLLAAGLVIRAVSSRRAAHPALRTPAA